MGSFISTFDFGMRQLQYFNAILDHLTVHGCINDQNIVFGYNFVYQASIILLMWEFETTGAVCIKLFNLFVVSKNSIYAWYTHYYPALMLWCQYAQNRLATIQNQLAKNTCISVCVESDRFNPFTYSHSSWCQFINSMR